MQIDLAKKFPRKVFNVIKLTGRLADKERLQVYLVGGVVRDILIGVPNYDLDFVVEGNGLRFSEVLNKHLKGTLTQHPAFMTATVACSGLRIDIATARKESYKSPAAYPDVESASIKEDLLRRDFTINAMAVSINTEGFGKLVDFYNGFSDLKKGVIRIMHDKSFIDDPTRVFRAIRFSTRFNFKIDPNTKRLMKESIYKGYLGEVNRGRIRKEVELLLKEKDPKKCLDAFSKFPSPFPSPQRGEGKGEGR